MFFNFYSNTLNSFYKNISRNIFNYYNSYLKIAKAYNSDTVKVQDSSGILMACGHDICSYTARNNMANFQYQAVMYLSGKLDIDKLKRAVAFSIEEQPVLACRLVETDEPYWKRINSIEDTSFCTLEECNNRGEALAKFLQNTLDMKKDINVRIKIIRAPEAADILAIKVNPSCFDGPGVREYIKRLAAIYTCIDKGHDTSIPNPQLIERKEEYRLVKELETACPQLSWNPQLDTPKRSWPFPWRQTGINVADYALCQFSKRSFEKIRRYGDSKGATVNDLILTAYYRTLFRLTGAAQGIPMDISNTVDLRNYLPENNAQKLRNFSGGFVTRIPRKPNETFEGTLPRVAEITKILKKNPTDSSDTMDKAVRAQSSFTYFNDYFECVSRADRIRDKNVKNTEVGCYPALYDLGNVSEDLISFGREFVADACIVPPVTGVPGLSILTSSYNGILTMSAGYCRGFITQKDMNKFLIRIKDELVRGCEK